MIKIFCVNTNEYIDVEGGLSLMQLAVRMGSRLPFTPICAYVNNKTESLSFCIYTPKRVEFLDFNSPSGRRAYVRSLCMILYRAVCEVLPGHNIRVEHSLSGGSLCHIIDRAEQVVAVSEEQFARIHAAMNRIVAENHPFVHKEDPTEEVIEIFRRQGLNSKIGLLETTGELYTPLLHPRRHRRQLLLRARPLLGIHPHLRPHPPSRRLPPHGPRRGKLRHPPPAHNPREDV